MQKYTQLMKDELLNKMRADREKEWDEFVSSWAARGWPLPDGSLISGFLEIGFKRMDVFIERLFETEKTAISKEAGTPSPKYFGDLAEEFKTIFQQEVSVIRSRAFQYTQGTRGPVSQSIIATVAHKEASIREATNRKVQIMEQELKLGIFKPVTYQTIQVTGDVAVINTGQVYGSIHARLERLSGTEPSQLVEAFSRISQAIKDSNVDDQVKCEQLQNIELLVEQYEIPEAQRKRGIIKSVIDGLNKSLPTVASLATLWGQFGPTITKAFGVG